MCLVPMLGHDPKSIGFFCGPAMSVNHRLLRIYDEELASILETPSLVRDLVEQRKADVVDLMTEGVAIVALTAQSDKDPLAFLRFGAPDAVSGWVGGYSEEDGRGVECEVDMGYGPASYYRNSFLRVVAQEVSPITSDVFIANCDMDWLEDDCVYPTGWRDKHRKQFLVEGFERYRACVLAAANAGQHLLVWNA